MFNQTDRQTDRQRQSDTDRQTDRASERDRDRQRQTDIQLLDIYRVIRLLDTDRCTEKQTVTWYFTISLSRSKTKEHKTTGIDYSHRKPDRGST